METLAKDTLKGNIKALLEETKREVLESIQPQQSCSYAGVAATNVNVNRANVIKGTPAQNQMPESFPIIIRAKDNTSKSLEEVKAKIKPLLKKPVRVVNARKNFKNEIVINTSSKEDAEVMKEAIEKSDTFESVTPKKKLPKLRIFGIKKGTDESSLLSEIIRDNFEGNKDLTDQIRVLFKQGERGDRPTTNWVISLPGSLFWKAMNQGRLFCGWHSFRVEEFALAARCKNCLRFGHIEKHCRAQTKTCDHCGEDGHSGNDCKVNKKETSPKCANCIRTKNKKHNHSPMDKSCPEFIRAQVLEKQKTDYS